MGCLELVVGVFIWVWLQAGYFAIKKLVAVMA